MGVSDGIDRASARMRVFKTEQFDIIGFGDAILVTVHKIEAVNRNRARGTLGPHTYAKVLTKGTIGNDIAWSRLKLSCD